MAAAEKGFAQGHEVRDRVVAITDELSRSVRLAGLKCVSGAYLLEHTGDKTLGESQASMRSNFEVLRLYASFCMVELYTSSKSPLC